MANCSGILIAFLCPLDCKYLAQVSIQFDIIVIKTLRKNILDDISNSSNKLLGKRVRDDINGNKNISWTVCNIVAILTRCCGICNKRFLGGLNSFGVLCHLECLRNSLLNTYYLKSRYGLDRSDYNHLPTMELNGYNDTGIYKGQYTYKVVWLKETFGLIPSSWTIHYLVHNNEVASEKYRVVLHRISQATEQERIRYKNNKKKS